MTLEYGTHRHGARKKTTISNCKTNKQFSRAMLWLLFFSGMKCCVSSPQILLSFLRFRQHSAFSFVHIFIIWLFLVPKWENNKKGVISWMRWIRSVPVSFLAFVFDVMSELVEWIVAYYLVLMCQFSHDNTSFMVVIVIERRLKDTNKNNVLCAFHHLQPLLFRMWKKIIIE